jgi:hypothetical protein
LVLALARMRFDGQWFPGAARIVAQMGVAIYVHLQPQVPASVLPLGIKPPVIPVVVLLLGLLTAFAVWKERRAEKASDTPTQ